MKTIQIILFALATVIVSAQEKNSNAGKVVSGSYSYSIEYIDDNNKKYGHKIEVKDGNPKVNIDLLKIKNNLAPSAKQPRSNRLTTSTVPTLKPKINFARTPQMAFQKFITAPITTPSFLQPQPAPAVQTQPSAAPATNMKFSSQQLALLLSQNKNPYLPLDKETEKQLSFAQSPAWTNLLAPIQQQQQQHQQQQPSPIQYSPQVQNSVGFPPQAQPINFGQSQQSTHSPVYNNQIIPTAQLQPFKGSQNIPSLSSTPSTVQQGGASPFGAASGYQSHYNLPQNNLPQSFPVSHSPAVPQTVSLPSSLQLSNNHVSSQSITSPQIQQSHPARYGSSTHSPVYNNQIIPTAQLQPFKGSQYIPSLSSTPSTVQQGGASPFGAVSGYQSHYNLPQNNLPQSFPISHSPAVPQTVSLPSSLQLSNNHVSSQSITSPQIQQSLPAGYGSSSSQNSYIPQNLAGFPNSLSQSEPTLQSTPVQYSMPQYQPSSHHNGLVQFAQQNSESPSIMPVKNEVSNLPQNFAFSQNQIVPNIPKDFNYVSSEAVNSPQAPDNYYGYPSTTSSGYAPQSSNIIVPYSQSGASSGVHTASPYSSGPEITYKPGTSQFTGQNNAYGSGLGNFASNEAPAYASIPSQGNVYGQNSVQGYTSDAASNQVVQSTSASGYNDGSKSYAIIPAQAQYAVPNQSGVGGYSGAGDSAQKSYRAFEYSPAPVPVTENANVRYVYVPSNNAPSNVK